LEVQVKVLILAGGKGTRLQALVADRPKPMAAVGERPFLCYLLDRLHDAGLLDVTLSVGHKADCIRQYFGKGYRGIALRYVEEDTPLGTGGAISAALEGKGRTPYLVMNGDTLFDVSYKGLIDCWRRRPECLAVAATPMQDCGRYGRVIVEDGIVSGFSEKKCGEAGLINAGLYVVSEQNLLDYEMPGTWSFETDFLQRYVTSLRPSAYISSGYFIDIGVPDELERLRSQMPFKGVATPPVR
jgi:D-glycero-alpha-D-manno-heptose 1-phosphate guanylyltransferase